MDQMHEVWTSYFFLKMFSVYCNPTYLHGIICEVLVTVIIRRPSICCSKKVNQTFQSLLYKKVT